jgi:ATP/maltotriose-dependent transcriptional regulator MalT
VNDQKTIAWSLSALGFWSEGQQVLDESLAMFRTLDDPYGLSHVLRRRAVWTLEHEPKDYAYARRLLDEALTSAREAGDGNATAWVLLLLGLTVWGQDQDARQTAALFEESLSAFQEIRNVAEACAPLIMLAHVEQVAGNTMRSQALYNRALILLQDLSLNTYGSRMISLLLAGLGSFAGSRREWEQAAKLLAAAEAGIPGFFGFFTRPEFDRLVASVRAQFGDAAFAAAWAEGKAMTYEQAIAYALEDRTAPVEMKPTEQVDDSQTIPRRQPASQSLADPLTERELEILCLIAEGMSNREIADQLVLAVSTVKWYVNEIFGKLHVTNRTLAVARARALGLFL